MRLQQTNELNRTCTFECDLMQQTTNNTRVHSSILASFFEWGVSDLSVLICGNLVGILFFSKILHQMIRQTVVEFCKLFGWYFCGYFFFVGSWIHVYDLTHFIQIFEREPEQKAKKKRERKSTKKKKKRERNIRIQCSEKKVKWEEKKIYERIRAKGSKT